MHVIVTGAGAPGARGTLHALRQGAATEGMNLVLIGTDCRTETVNAAGFDEVVHVPVASSADYLTAVQTLVDRYSARALIPQTTREIEVLSRERNHISVPIMVSEHQAIARANSKVTTTSTFAHLALPHPRFASTRTREDLLAAVHDFGYPTQQVVIKLPVSNGSRGVRILSEEVLSFAKFQSQKPSGLTGRLSDLLATLDTAPEWPELLVTEFVNGPEYTVDAYIGRSGEIAIPRRRDEMRTGISTRTTLEPNAKMGEWTLAAAKEMGLHGVFGFQYILRDDEPLVIECNPRIQGTMVASLLSGNNLIWLGLRDVLGLNPPQVPLRQDWTGGRLDRYWGALLTHNDGRSEIV